MAAHLVPDDAPEDFQRALESLRADAASSAPSPDSTRRRLT
jgi:hypothetical protein